MTVLALKGSCLSVSQTQGSILQWVSFVCSSIGKGSLDERSGAHAYQGHDDEECSVGFRCSVRRAIELGNGEDARLALIVVGFYAEPEEVSGTHGKHRIAGLAIRIGERCE